MAQFYGLKVKEVRKETPDTVSIALQINEDQRSEFTYQPGQYVTLKLQVNGQEIRRSYSLCSNPFGDEGF